MKTARSYIFSSSIISVVLFSSLFSQAANSDGMYKWVDSNGNVTYQSTPPPGTATKVEKPEILVNSPEKVLTEDEKKTEAEKKASESELPKIIFYSKPECSSCDDARNYFADASVDVEEIDISDNSEEASKLKEKLGHNNVPTIVVGNKSITGFQKGTLDQILRTTGFDIPLENE
jgi:glutaredoxin